MRARRLLLTLSLALTVVMCLAAGAFHFYLPRIIELRAREIFAAAGFERILIEDVSAGSKNATLRGITLDEDGFSTVSKIKITYDWPVLAGTGKIDTMHIQGLSLTMLQEKADPASILAALSHDLPFRTIEFENVTIDVDTDYGVLRFRGDGRGTVKDDGGTSVQALFSGEQSQIALKTSWSGEISPGGSWQLGCEISDGRLNAADITASRAGGWLSITNSGNASTLDTLKISGQIAAGMLNIGPVPFRNVTALIDGSGDEYRIIFSGTGGGSKSLALNMELVKSPEGISGTGRLKIPDASDLSGFATALAQTEYLSFLASPDLSSMPPLTMDMRYEDGGLSLDMHDDEGTFGISGLLRAEMDGMKLTPEELSISAFDLAMLVKMAGIERDMSVSGKLDGHVDFEPSNAPWFIREGVLRSSGHGGRIAYRPEKYPAFMDGEDGQMEIIRNAVTGFDYDEMRLVFSGDLMGEMQAVFLASGYNREVFGDSPVNIELNMGKSPQAY